MSKQMRQWLKQGWPPFLVVILFLFCWQMAVIWWEVPKWLLPSPLDIFTEGMASYSRLLTHAIATIRLAIMGFTFGTLSGIILAILLHLLPGLRRGFYPLLILSQNIPIIALAPLLTIWFGFGMTPKLILIILVSFFPIVVATLDGLNQVDRNMLNYMKMIGANRKVIFLKLEFPSSLPHLFSGLKISGTYSVMGAVISEWLGAKEGIGVFMTLSSASFRTDRVFMAIFVIVLLSLTLFGIILLLERVLIPWNRKDR